MTQPFQPYQPQSPHPQHWQQPAVPSTPPHARRRPVWPWVVGVIAVLIAVLVIAAALDSSNSSGRDENVPAPISRAELMAEYAKINPIDRSATPAKVDEVARTACSKLRGGASVDKLITAFTDIYRSNATAVVRLLVSYECPEYLKDFK